MFTQYHHGNDLFHPTQVFQYLHFQRQIGQAQLRKCYLSSIHGNVTLQNRYVLYSCVKCNIKGVYMVLNIIIGIFYRQKTYPQSSYIAFCYSSCSGIATSFFSTNYYISSPFSPFSSLAVPMHVCSFHLSMGYPISYRHFRASHSILQLSGAHTNILGKRGSNPPAVTSPASGVWSLQC